MAEYFVFRPVAPKLPHWSTIPNDLFSLGVAGAMAAAAITAGVGAAHYDFDYAALPGEFDDGLGNALPVDVDVF